MTTPEWLKPGIYGALLGAAFVGIVWYIVSMYIMHRIYMRILRTTLKKYTDTLSEEYRKSLDEYKRQHRI